MNFEITTVPSGRSPENKIHYGSRTRKLDLSRPKYNKIGKEVYFWEFFEDVNEYNLQHNLVFYTSGMCFRVQTNDDRHAQFVRNMFTVVDDPHKHAATWTIYHNTLLDISPTIAVNLDARIMCISGTTFLGEIKKGVFSILGFELPERNILPMHCAAFTYESNHWNMPNVSNVTTNLMFGLSGTGKTTLSSDPDYRLISDDEVYWAWEGINMIETGCYAKSEGLTKDTHKTIFDAVEKARENKCLVVENPGEDNARLSYPLSMVANAYNPQNIFGHPDNIFFLTMDAEGIFPPITRISGETVREFFETGYTSAMPGTENGVNEIQRTLSPCYGSPFMPRKVKEYSDMLMQKVDQHNCNVFLVNTGMDGNGKRFPLEFTRNCIKQAIDFGTPREDHSKEISQDLKDILSK